MKKIIIPLLSILAISHIIHSHGTDVYITIDENGNRIFSDTPSKESRKHKIKEISTVPAIKLPKATASPVDDSDNPVIYQQLSIINPKANSSLSRDNLGSFTVSAQVSPPLQAQDEAVLLFDGQEISSGQALSWQVSDADRGAHDLQVIIRQRDNKREKISSASQKIFVKR